MRGLLTGKTKLIDPNRKTLMHDDFELEYSVFLKTNNQNLKQINNRDRAETETP